MCLVLVHQFQRRHSVLHLENNRMVALAIDSQGTELMIYYHREEIDGSKATECDRR